MCVNQCCAVWPCVGHYTEYGAVQHEDYKGSKPSCCPCAATGLYMADPGSEESLREDARNLYRAMKGLGTRESDIIRVFANRTQPQLEKIKVLFKTHFDPHTQETPDQVMVRWIKGDTSGDFQVVLLAMMKDRTWADALVVNQAIMGHLKIGVGTIDAQLIEIFATRSPNDLRKMCVVYEQEYKQSLYDAIKGDTSFRYQDTLLALLDRADFLAQRLHGAMVDRPGTDNMRVIRILTSIGRQTDTYREIMNEYDDVFRLGVRDDFAYEITLPSMAEVKAAYLARYGKSLIDVVAGETSLQFRDCLMVLLEEPAKVLADSIHYAMAGMGTEDAMLIELLTCHSNREIVKANAYYQEAYGKSIADEVKGDTSGDYEGVLVALTVPREYTLAKGMRKAMEGFGTDDYRLLAGFTGKSRREIFRIQRAYTELYQRDLEADIRNETSFWFRRALTYMLRQGTEPYYYMAPRNLRRIRDC